MATVPWIQLYQNWPRHKKTMALRKALGTAEPILCLWLWAAENAPGGCLEGMSTEDIEEAACWHGKRGKAVSAMISARFIDVGANGIMSLHNWANRAGAGVANLERRREKARERMRLVRANSARTEREHGENVGETLSLSLDLGTSGSSSLSASDPRDPSACTTEHLAPSLHEAGRAVEDAKRDMEDQTPSPVVAAVAEVERSARATLTRIRPDDSHNLKHCLKVAVEKAQGIMWAAEPFAAKNADEWFRSLGDVEKALPDIERKIAIFAADKDMQPWTVKKFCEKFNGIGLPKLQFGKAPTVSQYAKA